ncbi:H/ACA ribonucleoprotein complex non-core subunit NAF1-like [Abrus precatorius]|uniref:H/ACA ribonucleoprotein complex non-core subunit NAF1 n=1 Tax=Abrus precatorius TaxID=3816 RepID=A0A8B8KHP5_ABRPR|nr:H/ACA ribonucleoprotein complex non-core subunit NAF1-like [Abrus precatorius]
MGEVEDPLLLNDLALADSFINFDYVPDLPDPIAVGPGSEHCNSIDEAIEKINLIEIGEKGNNDDVRVENEITDDAESESSESESDSSTSTTNRDSDENEVLEEGEIVDSDDNDDDDDDDDNCAAERPDKSKNELEILPLVPAVNVALEPHHEMLPVGVVMSILGARVIVEAVEKHDPLNEGSILWMTESRTPVGLIDEIFGPVKYPYYIVRYSSENEVPEGLRTGTLISFVPEFANYVLNNKDLYKKGYDASGLNDEEVSDEAEFSDDEKEAEYKRMQTMTKRSIHHQNPGKKDNSRKKVPPKDGFVPAFPTAPASSLLDLPLLPVAPATSLHDHGHCSPFSGIRQGLCGETNIVPPFPPVIAGPNLTTSGIWTNGTTLPLQHSAVLSNGFPANGVSWYLNNAQFSHQLPVPAIPFQQQLGPSHGFPPATIFPAVQPNNMCAQLMHGQRPVDHNQITFELNSPFFQIQPPINLLNSSFPSNQHAPPQFNPGANANHGRKSFHRGCRKGWQPAK